jgi:regulator of nucleoside diphosphate kinase
MPISIRLTEPDAERLTVLHRFVRTPIEGEHLRRLEEKIADADVVEPEAIPADVVTMNSRVLVTDLNSGESAVYTVVFPSGADARRHRVSVLGALGSSLLGRKSGDEIEYSSSAGRERCRIDGIVYQPEAAGDYSA